MEYISLAKNYFLPSNIIIPAIMPIDSDICPVCHDDIKNDCNDCNTCKYTTPCGHTFHHKCVKVWFSEKDICPVCRTTVITSNIRNSCTSFEYIKPSKTMNNYLFFLYLIGCSSKIFKDVDKMMSMALESKSKITKPYVTLFRYLFFSSAILTKTELLDVVKTLEYLYKVLEITAIIFSFLFSLFDSTFITSNWFRLLLLYQMLHYDTNINYSLYSKEIFYKNGINPLYFIIYNAIILLIIPLFVLPSFFIFNNIFIKITCAITLICFLIKYILIVLSAIATIVIIFTSIRVEFNEYIHKEFTGETNYMSMFTNNFNRSSFDLSSFINNYNNIIRTNLGSSFSDPYGTNATISRARTFNNINQLSLLTPTDGLTPTDNLSPTSVSFNLSPRIN